MRRDLDRTGIKGQKAKRLRRQRVCKGKSKEEEKA